MGNALVTGTRLGALALAGVVGGEKVFEIGRTIADFVVVYQSEKLTLVQKISRVASGTLFIIFQTADLLNAGCSPSAGRLFINIGAGAANLLQRGVQRYTDNESLTVNDFVLLVFRISDVFFNTAILRPDWLAHDNIQIFSELGLLLSTAFLEKKIVESVRNKVIQNAYVVIGFFLACFPKEDCPFEIRIGQDGIPYMICTEQYFKLMEEFISFDSIDKMKVIPGLVATDPILQYRTCLLTKKPIRYVRVLRGNEHEDRAEWYEKEAIEYWLKNEPNKRPVGWPEDVPYSADQLCEVKSSQNQIDKVLRERHNAAKAAQEHTRKKSESQASSSKSTSSKPSSESNLKHRPNGWKGKEPDRDTA